MSQANIQSTVISSLYRVGFSTGELCNHHDLRDTEEWDSHPFELVLDRMCHDGLICQTRNEMSSVSRVKMSPEHRFECPLVTRSV